jgi:hypothetical protein
VIINPPATWEPALGVEGFLEPAECALLFDLAAAAAGCIVEVGSFRGRSTVVLALGARAGHGAPVFAVEPHETFEGPLGGSYGPADRRAFFENLLALDVVEHVRLLNTSSEVIAPGWSRGVGLLWIDGDHAYEGVRRDLDCWHPHLLPGAVVALHDALDPDLGPSLAIAEELASGRFERLGAVEQTVVLRRRR